MGRPKGSKNKRRGPGRPPGSTNKNKAARRGPGRPPLSAKRGRPASVGKRGRPAGSTGRSGRTGSRSVRSAATSYSGSPELMEMVVNLHNKTLQLLNAVITGECSFRNDRQTVSAGRSDNSAGASETMPVRTRARTSPAISATESVSEAAPKKRGRPRKAVSDTPVETSGETVSTTEVDDKQEEMFAEAGSELDELQEDSPEEMLAEEGNELEEFDELEEMAEENIGDSL